MASGVASASVAGSTKRRVTLRGIKTSSVNGVPSAGVGVYEEAGDPERD